MKKRATLSEILSRLESAAEEDHLTLGTLLASCAERGLGIMLILPALIVILPTGAIPGVPAVAAVVMAIIAAHMFTGQRKLWLPARVANMSLPGQSLGAGLRRIRPVARWFDRWFEARFSWFARSRFATQSVALATILLCVPIFILGVIPGLPAALSLAILVFALGLAVQNGLLLFIGYGATLAIGAFIAWALPWIWPF